MPTPQERWSVFLNGFKAALDEMKDSALLAAWRDDPSRTKFYKTMLMPRVGILTGLHYQPEFPIRGSKRKVDYAFLDGHWARPPVVLAESEHVPGSACADEIPKLLSVSAPVRILMSCMKWNKDLWGHGRGRNQLREWCGAVSRHRGEPHIFALMVGEKHEDSSARTEALRFYAYPLDCVRSQPLRDLLGRDPFEVEPADAVIFERTIPWR